MKIVLGSDLSTPVTLGADAPLVFIAGPCVIESRNQVHEICGRVKETCAALGFGFVFKASFDKANRTSIDSFRGPGMETGLDILASVRTAMQVPITTDVHLPEQCARVSQVVDLIQIPAFLCRQTDLLMAAGATGKPVNIKKGQFMAPRSMRFAAEKAAVSGASGVMLTERGTSFGYGDLVVDMRGIQEMREHGYPVCFDATHSVQRPSSGEATSGGARRFVSALTRAAVAVGIDALFAETHPDPERALSDGPNMIPLDELPTYLEQVRAIRDAL